MKKVNKFFLLGGLLSVAAITSSCSNSSSNPAESGSGSTVEKETIKIQFVPSNAPDKLATLAKKMAPLLEKIEPNYKFSITTGTDYAATTTALLADQIDIGFLTASGYAEATLKNPGKVEVLVTSVRDGYQVQKDYKTEAEQIKAMNGEVEGYEYLGQQSTEQVN